MARLSEWVSQSGWAVVRVEAEVGSGMNGARRKVRRLLADPRVATVAVERRDRLGRMNTELVEAALSAHGRGLVVLDCGEVTDDVVCDVVEVLTSLCARLYGRGSARNRRSERSGVRNAMSGRQCLSVLVAMMTAMDNRDAALHPRRAAREADELELAEAYLRAMKDRGDTDGWAAGALHAARIHHIGLGDGVVVPVFAPLLEVVG
jgi:hypothetical protein